MTQIFKMRSKKKKKFIKIIYLCTPYMLNHYIETTAAHQNKFQTNPFICFLPV